MMNEIENEIANDDDDPFKKKLLLVIMVCNHEYNPFIDLLISFQSVMRSTCCCYYRVEE